MHSLEMIPKNVHSFKINCYNNPYIIHSIVVPNSQHGLDYHEILFHLNGWVSVHPSFDCCFF